jgi:predicted deacylase
MHPEITTLPLLHMASGDMLQLQYYRFVGTQPGKTVYLQSNLHGAEIVGNQVIARLLEYLQSLSAEDLYGEMRLVPVCNPIGVNTRAHHFSSGRFNPYDGRDWNRIFWDCEQTHGMAADFAKAYADSDRDTIQQAYRQQILHHFAAERETLTRPEGVPIHTCYRTQLQHLALEADLVIDLHSSGNQGLVYVYYFRDRESSIPYFDLDLAIWLDRFDGNAFDESFMNPWLALEQAFAELGRSLQFDIEAWTLELGTGMKLDAIAVERGVNGILNYLRHQGVLRDDVPVFQQSVPRSRSSQLKKYYATSGGFVKNRVALGATVQSGDRLYELVSFNKLGQPPKTITVAAAEAGIVYDLSTNEAVSQGEYVLGLLPLDAGPIVAPKSE